MPLASPPTRTNVADRLTAVAARMPDAVAIATPGQGDVAGKHAYATCTFGELEADALALARGLVDLGVRPGQRLVLLVKPGIEFVKLVFALLRTGAVTVLVDPGMGRKHLVNCLAAAEPDGFIAISPAQAVRTVLRRRFPDAKLNVTVGRRWFWGGVTYRQLLARGRHSHADLPETNARRCRGDHLYLRQHGAAEGGALHAPDVRYASDRDPARSTTSFPAAPTWPALRCSASSTRRWA